MTNVSQNKTAYKFLPLLCLLIVLPASQLLAAESIIGTWEVRETFDQWQSTSLLSITKSSEGALIGEAIGGFGQPQVTALKFADNKLSFTRISRWGDTEYKSTFSGTLEKGKITGTISNDRGDSSVVATRVKPKPAALGQWELTMKRGDREFTNKISVRQTPEGKLEAEWTSRRGTTVISDVNVADAKLTFKRTSTYQDRERQSTFEGIVKGNTLTGTMKSERGETQVTGKRLGTELIGKWELTTTSERGDRKSLLLIDTDLTGRYQLGFTLVPTKNLKLEDGNLTFDVETKFGDSDFKMSFKGKLTDKTITGETTSERGTNKVTGKKILPKKLEAKPAEVKE